MDAFHASTKDGSALFRPVVPHPTTNNFAPMEIEERGKQRITLLCGRQPVLFRELFERDCNTLHWNRLFRSL